VHNHRKLLNEVDSWEMNRFMVAIVTVLTREVDIGPGIVMFLDYFSKAKRLLVFSFEPDQCKHGARFYRNFAFTSARRTRISHVRLTL